MFAVLNSTDTVATPKNVMLILETLELQSVKKTS